MPPSYGGRRAVGRMLTDEEKKNMPKVTKALLARILSYLKPYWLQFLMVFLAILVSSVVGLLPSIITGRIVDQALVGNDLALLIRLLFTALAAMLASQLVGVLENYINAWISQRIIFDMRNQMYRHLQRMSQGLFTTNNQGDVITRMTSDVNQVQSGVNLVLRLFLRSPFIVFGAMIMAFTIDFQSALIFAGLIAVLCLVVFGIMLITMPMYKRVQTGLDKVTSATRQNLSGIRVLRAFCKEEDERLHINF